MLEVKIIQFLTNKLVSLKSWKLTFTILNKKLVLLKFLEVKVYNFNSKYWKWLKF
jgi:hypothetical protein